MLAYISAYKGVCSKKKEEEDDLPQESMTENQHHWLIVAREGWRWWIWETQQTIVQKWKLRKEIH